MICQHCQGLIKQRSDERPGRFKKRLYCSYACRNAAVKPEIKPDRLCDECGKPLVQRSDERIAYFAKRRFCNAHCVQAYRHMRLSMFGVRLGVYELMALLAVGRATVYRIAHSKPDLITIGRKSREGFGGVAG